MQNEIVCNSCKAHFFLKGGEKKPTYCPFCSHPLEGQSEGTEVSFIQDQKAGQEEVLFSIGHYQVLKEIGKGGMGEVFLAYDTICGRKIALKRIRTDLAQHKTLYARFLQEARITAQLAHPSIIPIYSIYDQGEAIYYTMPYVEGETLKHLLVRAKKLEQQGIKSETIGAHIPALIRIFMNVAQSIAYAHSHGVLHRDLKGENIICGKFGEVMLLDWGLSRMMQKEPKPKKTKERVVGTVTYLSPERALGEEESVQGDIYALGVILYYILTLHPPFRRGTLKEFLRSMKKEVFIDPAERAPYREVPPILSQICKKCLEVDLKLRYSSVEELIRDLQIYVDGRSEWFPIAGLDIQSKKDWEFQENILLAEQFAITSVPDATEWVSLMISKRSFNENSRITTRIKTTPECHGVGFLMSVPEPSERKHLLDGYCLWVGTATHKTTKLLRSAVEVVHAPEVFLKPDTWYTLLLENVDNNIHFYIDNKLQFSYISHIPLTGTHVGFIMRDNNFEMEKITVSLGSQNLQVSCLAVPDAFFAHKDYAKAFSEYRRIGYTFPGRAEGREALFRAGVTLIEQGLLPTQKGTTNEFFEMALQQFSELHGTAGAPLEYLGKALVYEASDEIEEEIKCYLLAFRRYPNHLLLHVLEEHIIYRMHECSRFSRPGTYALALLASRHIRNLANSVHTKRLFNNLHKHAEKLPFFEEDPLNATNSRFKQYNFNLLLSFWLAKPYFIEELLVELEESDLTFPILTHNGLFALLELGAVTQLQNIRTKIEDKEALRIISYAKFYNTPVQGMISLTSDIRSEPTSLEWRLIIFFFERMIDLREVKMVEKFMEKLSSFTLSKEKIDELNQIRICYYLLEKRWERSQEIFDQYPLEFLVNENSPFYFLYGCQLYAHEGPAIAEAHFSGVLEVAYPRSWMLGTHYIKDKISEGHRWFSQSFLYEKRALYRQLSLYYSVTGDKEQREKYRLLVLATGLKDETEG